MPVDGVRRSLELDVLRFLAVALVLIQHFWIPGDAPSWLKPLMQVLGRGGWVGVELFFVLSGFLISGLLFSEYRRFGTIKAARFLARRAFKIYPAFYAFIAFWILVALRGRAPCSLGQSPERSSILAELPRRLATPYLVARS